MNRRRFLSRCGSYAGAMGICPIIYPHALDLRARNPSENGSSQDLRYPAGQDAIPWPDLPLTDAVVVLRPGELPNAEQAAATVLVEEVERRTGIRLSASTSWPADKTLIAITSVKSVPGWGRRVPTREGTDLAETRSEGYRLYVDSRDQPPIVWVTGGDARGTLFGVGSLLRRLNWSQGKLAIPSNLDLATAPAYAIRGHQLGYRPQANSYDAWSVAQFEQYIRELTFFGVNSIEGIPFQDDRTTPVMKVPRREMNRALGEICQRYGLDYWVWVPADFSLKDEVRRMHMLKQCAEFFRDTPALTGFFFPGGDPGHNPPDLVFPFLAEVAKLLSQTHREAKIWLSLQLFTPAEREDACNYIDRELPSWLGGLVAGPSSPALGEMRKRLPKQYKLRDYPDLTHNKLCQHQVPEWDQAFALTEGREAANPRPAEFAAIFGHLSSYTDGFISYSDGVHDDVNKTIWSALSWDPHLTVREILIDYAGVYLRPDVAERTADAILALEKNWHGPLIDNGAVEATLLEGQQLAKVATNLEGNWRWQMLQLRANYDAYVRRRLVNETRLESGANTILANADKLGSDQAMKQATDVLKRAVTQPVSVELRTRISELCDQLFHSIGLQTSVQKYYAIEEERGAVLDFLDYPLNNRWWLEDQFKAIRTLGSEREKSARLQQLATWEHPGPGSFYDDVGNIAKSPHVVRCDPENGPPLKKQPGPNDRGQALLAPLAEASNGKALQCGALTAEVRDHRTFWWWDSGKSRARLSWQVTMWPPAVVVVYEGVDPNATYVVRTTGYGQELLRINGERVEPTLDGKGMGEFKEFPVAAKYLKDRKLILTWDRLANEEDPNSRENSRLAEVWLIKNPSAG